MRRACMVMVFVLVLAAWASAKDITQISPAQLEDLVAKNKGNVLVVDFFATWCPPCRQEIPGFIALQNKFSSRGVSIVGVSLDEGGADVVGNFAKEMGINYDLYLGGSAMSQKYRIRAIPTTYVYDRTGKKSKTHIGFVPQEEFEKQIEELLK